MDTRPRDPSECLPVTPALFHVLLALADGQKHGCAVLKEVAARTDGAVALSTGTLYGIIKRLLADGLITQSAVGSTDRRNVYRLIQHLQRALPRNSVRLPPVRSGNERLDRTVLYVDVFAMFTRLEDVRGDDLRTHVPSGHAHGDHDHGYRIGLCWQRE